MYEKYRTALCHLLYKFRVECWISIRSLETKHSTVDPLYTDTRYNDKIQHNDNLTGTKPSFMS